VWAIPAALLIGASLAVNVASFLGENPRARIPVMALRELDFADVSVGDVQTSEELAQAEDGTALHMRCVLWTSFERGARPIGRGVQLCVIRRATKAEVGG
jgi:hypothetical protein